MASLSVGPVPRLGDPRVCRSRGQGCRPGVGGSFDDYAVYVAFVYPSIHLSFPASVWEIHHLAILTCSSLQVMSVVHVAVTFLAIWWGYGAPVGNISDLDLRRVEKVLSLFSKRHEIIQLYPIDSYISRFTSANYSTLPHQVFAKYRRHYSPRI